MAAKTISVKQAAEALGVSEAWVRLHIDAGTIKPKKPKKRGAYRVSPKDLEALRAAAPHPAEGEPLGLEMDDAPAPVAAILARYADMETERSGLLAQIAWERALAQEREKALELERKRSEQLAAEIETQRARVEALKSLSVWDRLVGRHKGV